MRNYDLGNLQKNLDQIVLPPKMFWSGMTMIEMHWSRSDFCLYEFVSLSFVRFYFNRFFTLLPKAVVLKLGSMSQYQAFGKDQDKYTHVMCMLWRPQCLLYLSRGSCSF